MIPLLLVSKDPKLVQNYIERYKINSLFFEVIPLTKEYSIDDIKNILKEIKVFFPKTRNYYLPNFHLSSIPAQNSFLKVLEEPPSNVQFILTTNNKDRLLPTIISRVKIIKLYKNTQIHHQTAEIISALEILTLSAGEQKKTIPNLPLSLFKIKDKEAAISLLLEIIIFFKDRLNCDRKSPFIIKETLRLKGLFENNNLNPQLTVDQVLIFILKTYSIN